jgi:DNA helicase-2/ATP-dependent DNA helicase PcrA
MRFEPTPEQDLVIHYPLLPLRVAAGAGTGKTATLAHRIVHLVEGQGVEPEQVLGITFTNKAAEELADRIRAALAEHARRGREVEVATYHGYAHRILQEFGALVGVERRAKVITPPFARQLLRDALGSGAWSTLDLTYPPAVIGRLAELGSDLGDNLLTAADLLAAAPAVEERDELWQQRVELAQALLRYEEEKRRLGSVDYADLIRMAHRLVELRPEIAVRIRERYRVVLLDEYQDTNPAQRELLLRIFGEGFPVTAVGDSAQTIYEWRGASLENFAEFPSHFRRASGEEAETRSLRTNRRSGQLILDLANRVQAEIGGDQVELVAREQAGTGRVATAWFRSAVEEAGWIAGEVRRLQEEGFRWSEMAVLFRKTKDMALVRDALEAADVPVEVASLGGLLAVPEVADLHAWLRLLGNQEDAVALARILLGSSFRLGLGDFVPLAEWVRSRTPWRDEDADEERLPAHTLLEAIDHLGELEGLSEESGRRLEEFRTTYRQLLQEAQGVSLVELCRRILDRVGAWPEVEAMSGPARLSARLNLYRFLDLAEEWSPIEGRPSLAAFLDYLDLLAEEGDEEIDSARLSGEDAVALLTVHRAKGLEWRAVFLPALYTGNFPADIRLYDDPFRHPQVLPFELRVDAAHLPRLPPDDDRARKEILRSRHLSQEWRTGYVAVTRAKQLLYLSGAHWYGQQQPQPPGALYELGRTQSGATDLGHQAEPGERPGVLRVEVSTEGSPDPAFPEGWEEAFRSVLEDPDWAAKRAAELDLTHAFQQEHEDFRQMLLDLPDVPAAEPAAEPMRVSVTGLVTYATCPKRFYWAEVDRMPRSFSRAARRGVDLHRRIELHNRGAMPLEDPDQAAYDLSPAEEGPEGVPGAHPFEAFRDSRFAAQRPLFVEAPFDVKVGRARVRGRVDAVYPEGKDGWEVVDFKSGRPANDPAPHVQLEAYAVAAREAGFAPTTPRRLIVTFAYLGDGLAEVSEEVDEPWQREAKRHLEELVGAIEEGHYQPTPSEACHTCDFLQFCAAGQAWMSDSR